MIIITLTSLWIVVSTAAIFAGKCLGQEIGFVVRPVPSALPGEEINALVTFPDFQLISIGFTLGTIMSVLQAFVFQRLTMPCRHRWRIDRA